MTREECPICGCKIEERVYSNGDPIRICLAGHTQYEIITNSFNSYTVLARETAIYPGRGSLNGLLYATIGLGGEAGEMLNKVKKILRDADGSVSDEAKKSISGELGDILWYVVAMCDELKLNLTKVATENIEKLQRRKKDGRIGGSGDNR